MLEGVVVSSVNGASIWSEHVSAASNDDGIQR